MSISRILVVDDSVTVRKALMRVLVDSGHEVCEAADGDEALTILQDGNQDIKLVFCDLNMPNKNGMELLQDTLNLRKSSGIPVVMLTTEGRPEYVDQARQLGANGWLVKPFHDEQIRTLTKRFLKI